MLAALLISLLNPAMSTDKTTDPFVLKAQAVLRGDIQVSAWEKQLYKRGMDNNVRCCGYTIVTCYGPWESPKMSGGPKSSSGKLLNITMCAAPKKFRFGTVIWTKWGIRIVEDRGGMVKMRGAKSHFDYYTKKNQGSLSNTAYAVIGGKHAK
jgi:hypothetical protein